MVDSVCAHLEKLIGEGLIGVAETARLLGTFRGGRPCHPSIVVRWCLDGVKLPDGRRLRLEHVRVTDRLMTTKPALMRFLAAQQTPAQVPASVPRSPTARSRASDTAASELSELGID